MECKLEQLLSIRCEHLDHINYVLFYHFGVLDYLWLGVLGEVLDDLLVLDHDLRHREVVTLLITVKHIFVEFVAQLLELAHVYLVLLFLDDSLHFFDVLFEFVELLLAFSYELVVGEELEDLQELFDFGVIDQLFGEFFTLLMCLHVVFFNYLTTRFLLGLK